MNPIRILVVEDIESDVDLMRRELSRGGIAAEMRRVETRERFEAELVGFKPQIILSDYNLPKFSGTQALAICREKSPETPFIYVSGSIGDHFAIEALRAGAGDFVIKQRLQQLAPAVQRALREVEERARGKRLEQQLWQSQKMEVVGRLAGGVAHDFNNLLTAISGYSELLLSSLAADDPNRADVEEIKKTVYRGAALTRQLLSFSRKQPLRPVVLDLNHVVADVEKMLARLIGEDIKLISNLDTNLGRILADVGQIEQVVMNLAVNSRDAMPKGGKLILETRNIELDANYIASHLNVAPGRYVMLAVSDTGCGMPPEILTHIFEPFFTTKEKGTGLGLSMVYGIARQFGAHVDVCSEVSKGTTFKIYFPRVEDALSAGGDKAVPLADLKGTETILLVDDEDAVRRLGRRTLEKNGYTVLEAKNAFEAIELAQSHPGELQILVTDLVMYGMNGYDLAKQILAKRNGLKILYLSGYTDEMIKNHITKDSGPIYFLPKPFSPNDLLRKIRETLDSKPSA